MEKTATSIIAAATARRNEAILGNSSIGDELLLENLVLPSAMLNDLPPTGAKVTRKRGTPAKKQLQALRCLWEQALVGSFSYNLKSPQRGRGLTVPLLAHNEQQLPD